MAGQSKNDDFSRLPMSLLRCFWSCLYLYVMMHAASVVVVAEQRWDKGFLWNTRLPDKLVYYDSLFGDSPGELWVLSMIASVLTSIYAAYGLASKGPAWNRDKPTLNKISMCIPYMATFLACCLFSICLLARHMFMLERSHTSMNLYAQLIVVLLFKILIMANMISAWLRGYVKLVDLKLDWDRGHISSLNFGELLNVLFCS